MDLESLLKTTDGSILKLLTTTYPEYEWLPWRFSPLPKDLSIESGDETRFIQALEAELHLCERSDWYRVSDSQLTALGANRYLKRLGGIEEVLKRQRPEIDWRKRIQLKQPNGKDQEIVK